MPTISGSNLSGKCMGVVSSCKRQKQTVLSRREVDTKWPWVPFPRTAIPTLSVSHSAALRPVLLEINHLSGLHREKKVQCQRRRTTVLSILFTFQGSYKLVRHTHGKCVYGSECVWFRKLTLQHCAWPIKEPWLFQGHPLIHRYRDIKWFLIASWHWRRRSVSVVCVCGACVCPQPLNHGWSLSWLNINSSACITKMAEAATVMLWL